MIETGTLKLRWTPNSEDIEILQADPVVLIDEHFLVALEAGQLPCMPHNHPWTTHPSVSLGDGILTIRGVNRTVSYGVGEPSGNHTRLMRLSGSVHDG